MYYVVVLLSVGINTFGPTRKPANNMLDYERKSEYIQKEAGLASRGGQILPLNNELTQKNSNCMQNTGRNQEIRERLDNISDEYRKLLKTMLR